KCAVATRMAFQTGNMMMQRHTITHFECPNARPNSHNLPGGFVTEYPWRGEPALLNFLDIRGADPPSRHLPQEITRPSFRNRHLLKPDIVDPAIHRGAHRLGDFGKHRDISVQQTQRLELQPGAATKVFSSAPVSTFQILIAPS